MPHLYLLYQTGLAQNDFCQFNGFNDFAVFVNTHVTGSDFVDQDNFVVVVTKFKFDVVQIQTCLLYTSRCV